jgi:hypothetical protein
MKIGGLETLASPSLRGALATKQSSLRLLLSGLLRGACHRAAFRADPLARNDEGLSRGMVSAAAMTRPKRRNRQRVNGACEFRGERRVNHAVALDPALPFEGIRYNIDPEMRLAAGPVAGMAFMKM